MEATNEGKERTRLHGIGETVKNTVARGDRQVRIRKPSQWVRAKLEAQRHSFSEPDADGRVIMTIHVEPETVIDNPEPQKTP